MKKSILINSQISYVISRLGHGDSITIGDSGLPIPNWDMAIDLAVKKGIPAFLDVLDAVLTEQRIEEVILAEEIKQNSPEMYQKIIKKIQQIEKADGIKVKYTKVSHEDFKLLTKDSKAIIRTGEFTPYANIILKSGVVF